VTLPLDAARLAPWLTACLDGSVPLDALTVQVAHDGRVHRVAGLAGDGDDASPASPAVAAGRLRAAGARAAWLAWPVAGDLSTLPGPSGVNRIALAAGQAVVVEQDGASTVLVPSRLGSSGVLWNAFAASPLRTFTSLGDAERGLREAMRAATDALDTLDVARTDTADESRVAAARERDLGLVLPPRTPARARTVLDTAQRLASLLAIAQESDGAAVSRGEAQQRRTVLGDVQRVVRHAFVAAVNATAEEHLRAR